MEKKSFADDIASFARVLRHAGLPVGPGLVLDALEAVHCVGITRREDVFAALACVFVKRHEHAPIFKQAFDLYFIADDAPLMDAASDANAPDAPQEASRRVQEALAREREAANEPPRKERIEKVEVQLEVSTQEVLQKKDFAQMSAEEQDEAIRAMQQFVLNLAPVASRRLTPNMRGRKLDMRRTLRASMRTGGELTSLRFLGRKQTLPPIVALLDISGSMSEYTRMFLHFLHALADHRKRVSVFLFGTRLSNVTRSLRARDPDDALAACSSSVEDWSGGTRIAPSLHRFNKEWSRRVLGQGAVVLLITDGLERDGDGALPFEMDRLHRSCRELIWLNPLLRFDGFEAKAKGIRQMLPHVDKFLPIHNLQSMADLLGALNGKVQGIAPQAFQAYRMSHVQHNLKESAHVVA